MSKQKKQYICDQCQTIVSQWAGQCAKCLAWNTLSSHQTVSQDKRSTNFTGYAGKTAPVQDLSDISIKETIKCSSESQEFDRVLGGGLVKGAVILIGGDPGIGKSTLLLQTLAKLSLKQKVLYITGEESLQQVALRAHRLQLPHEKLRVFSETHVESILETMKTEKPSVVVIDSIQTMYSDALNQAPGNVSQLKETAQLLVKFAKANNTTIFLVGHVTKEGALAGPRVLEHMVDTVLYFEGQNDNRFRLLRAFKNRFGTVNEIALFAMTELGLKDIKNPSALFLTKNTKPLPGSSILVTREGTRPLLIEIQALVDDAHGNPKRVCLGIDSTRLMMLLAVMHRHGGIYTFDKDIFINLVGGVKITETASDVALVIAIFSSLNDIVIPQDLLSFGEIGLAGEIRPVPHGVERLAAAVQHGFTHAIVPKANQTKEIMGIKTYPISHISELIDCIHQVNKEKMEESAAN